MLINKDLLTVNVTSHEETLAGLLFRQSNMLVIALSNHTLFYVIDPSGRHFTQYPTQQTSILINTTQAQPYFILI